MSTNQLSIDDIRYAIKRQYQKSKLLKIEGYVSESAGSVTNYSAALLGPEGYRDILEHTLELVDKNRFPSVDFEAYDLTETQWLEGFQEQVTSWRISYGCVTGEIETQKPKPKENLTYQPESGFYVKSPDDGVTVLRNLYVVQKKVVKSADRKSSPLQSKNPIVRAKALARQVAPINNYLARLNIQPSNIKSIS